MNAPPRVVIQRWRATRPRSTNARREWGLRGAASRHPSRRWQPQSFLTSKHLRRPAGSERIGDQNTAQDVQDAATWLFLASSIVSSEKRADQKRPYVETTYNW